MADSKNWPFKPLLGSQEAINNHPIKKGQLLIRRDGGRLYFDQDDETRILVADVGGGGGGGDGDKSRYTVEKITDNETGEVSFKLEQTLNDEKPSFVGAIIKFRGSDVLVQYGEDTVLLNSALSTIAGKISDLEQTIGDINTALEEVL